MFREMILVENQLYDVLMGCGVTRGWEDAYCRSNRCLRASGITRGGIITTVLRIRKGRHNKSHCKKRINIWGSNIRTVKEIHALGFTPLDEIYTTKQAQKKYSNVKSP